MRRHSLLHLASALALLGAAACSDVPAAPRADARNALTSAPSYSVSKGRSVSTTFTIRAKGDEVPVSFSEFGGEPLFSLKFPADAVCADDSPSGTCVPVGHSVQVTATLYTNVTTGHRGVVFSPELRFDPNKVVTLSTLRERPAVFAMEQLPKAQQNWGIFAILYTPDEGLTVLDDAVNDPDVATHVDLSTGRVWRRLKHFSGYNSGFGLTCDPQADPRCVADGLGGTVVLQ